MPAFPPFRPDAGELQSSTLNNVAMLAQGVYGPRQTLATAPGAAALAAAPRGALAGILPSGTFKGFVATSTNIYFSTASYGWTSLALTLAIPAGFDESLCQFGVYMLGSNTADGLYAYNMDTPAGMNAVSGSPKARYIFTTNNVVVALGDTTSNLARLKNCAFGDHTNWTTGGALTLDMQDGGAFTGGGDLGAGAAIILQDRAVRRLTFGNAPPGALYTIQKLADDVGCVHPRAQAGWNGKHYFVSQSGRFFMTDGTAVYPIGAGKVDLWFKARCADLKQVWATVDPAHNIVRFRYKGPGDTDTLSTNILDYNYVEQEFIPGTETTTAIFRMGTSGYTWHDLAALGAWHTWAGFPWGSDVWKGSAPVAAGLDSAFKLAFFNGSAAVAALETSTQGDGTSKLVNFFRPLTDDSAATIELGVKDVLSADFDWKDPATLAASGRAAVRGRGLYQRYRENHAAGATWTRSLGYLDLDQRTGGPR